MESKDSVITGRHEAAARAEELRASLTSRLDVEHQLAQATATRQAAVVDAEALLSEAQEVAALLVSDSRRAAEQDALRARTESESVMARARADAEAVRSAAEADVEEYRRRVREEVRVQLTREVAEQAHADRLDNQKQSEALIDDWTTSVRILGVALQSAQAHVAELMGTLEALRTRAANGTHPLLRSAGDPEAVSTRREESDDAVHVVRTSAAPAGADPDAQLDGGSGASGGTEVPEGPEAPETPKTPVVVRETTAEAEAGGEADAEAEAPTTALAAFLETGPLDHPEAATLSPSDDAGVGARYLRDARRGRRRRTQDDRLVDPVTGEPVDDADAVPDRPLSWLFRHTP